MNSFSSSWVVFFLLLVCLVISAEGFALCTLLGAGAFVFAFLLN